MPVELTIVESVTELETTVTEIILESSSTPGPAGPGVPEGGTTGQALVKASDTDYDTEWDDVAGGPGGGAPTDVNYLVGTADGGLSNEIVVGTTPGGELGGTWASPTVDATHSGSSHAAVQAAAEATAAAALSAHLTDTEDAHDASAISVSSTTLSGTGTDVQAVFEEIDNLLDDHSARHENGGADEISLTGLSGVPADVPPSTRSLTAGDGLSGGGDLSSDRTFTVNVDNTTIELNSDALRVKAGGIGVSHLADASITLAKLDEREVQITVIDDATVLTTGDGKARFFVPASLNGKNLISCYASVVGSSSSGLPTIQLRRVRSATPADMLSTRITIDESELNSTTADAPAVIDTGNDDVATGDQVFVDVDVAGTGTDGLIVGMVFG